MKPYVQQVVFDSTDVPAAVAFWSALLDARSLVDAHGWGYVEGGTLLAFQPVEQDKLPELEGGSRVHFDIVVPSLEEATARALELGATVKRGPFGFESGAAYAVFADPQGNAFCLLSDPTEAWYAPKDFG